MENFRISIRNRYTLKCTIAINKLFTLVWTTSINQFSCKYFFQLTVFLYKIRQIGPTIHISLSEYFTSISTSGLPTFLISVKNMNLLSSSIYKHLKTNLIKYKQSLILWECGSQLISVLSNIFQFKKTHCPLMTHLCVYFHFHFLPEDAYVSHAPPCFIYRVMQIRVILVGLCFCYDIFDWMIF